MAHRSSARSVTLTAFVGRPLQEVAKLLSADAQTVIAGGHHAGDDHVVIKLEVPLGNEGAVSRAAVVALGVAEWHAGTFCLPLTVTALEREQWFPTFTGALEADEVGVGDTRLQLRGTYQLPLGALGRATGRAGADKLARASLYSLFVSVVAHTERQLQETAPTWRPAAAGEIVREHDDHPLGA